MPTADELYTQTINEQREYLAELQKAFNARCDEITAQAKQKLTELAEDSLEERKKVFEEQKKLLDEALNDLKNNINISGGKTRKRLEEIHAQREEKTLADLEAQITQI